MRDERRLIELAQRHHQLLTRADVRTSGVTSAAWCRSVDQGRWLELAPKVWCHAAASITWEMRARAGLLWLGPHAALFGHSAAAWWGLDGSAREVVQLLVPRGRRSVAPSLELHTTSVRFARDVLHHEGLRVTSVTRTVLDLASIGASARMIEAAIDSGIRSRRTSLPTLTALLAEWSRARMRGARLLHELLLDSGGESFLERRFLRMMRSNQLPRPRCQVIHRTGSTTVARVDFQFPSSNLVVEVSGRLGHSSDRDRRKDARRRNDLVNRGLEVLEFVTSDVLDDPDDVLTTLRTALERGRGHTPTERMPVGV